VEIANCGVVANVEGNRELPMSFIVFDASSWNDAIRLSCSGGMARTVCASKQMIERYTIKFGPATPQHHPRTDHIPAQTTASGFAGTDAASVPQQSGTE
jgi:hypothetical protein